MRDLDIENKENEELMFENDVKAMHKYDLCSVGRFLSENLSTTDMKSKLANVWRSAMGINIKDIGECMFLFQFYYKEDMQWVLNGGPWSFDNITPVFDIIPHGENPAKVLLFFLNFWIKIYDLPSGFMTEAVGRQLEIFFGEYIMYDQ